MSMLDFLGFSIYLDWDRPLFGSPLSAATSAAAVCLRLLFLWGGVADLSGEASPRNPRRASRPLEVIGMFLLL